MRVQRMLAALSLAICAATTWAQQPEPFCLPADLLSAEQSTARPGDVPVPLAKDTAEIVVTDWTSATSPSDAPGEFVLTLKRPVESGSIMVYDGGSLSYRVGRKWIALAKPSPRRRLRVVAFPHGQEIEAVKVRVPSTISRSSHSGQAEYLASLPLVALLPTRLVNVAPEAGASASSADEPSQGFRPMPWRNKPETLVDGFVHERFNFFTAPRDAEITRETPEWVLLHWDQPQQIDALLLMRGNAEEGLGHGQIEVFVGSGDPRFATDQRQWQELKVRWTEPGRFRGMQFGAFRGVRTQGLRLKSVGGVGQIGLGEIAVLSDLGQSEAPGVKPSEGIVPIPFEIPDAGKVTIQVRNRQGEVVANPTAGVEFPAGKNVAWWNLEDVVGEPVLAPGEYVWRGLYNPGLKVEYKFTFFPFPLAHVAWQTPDRRGGWLADHEPPRTIARAGDRMWLGAFAEAGDSIVEVDAEMNKLWGIDRIWVAIPSEICTDGKSYYGFCEGGWIKDNQAIIQIDTETKRSRKVFQREIPGKEATSEDMMRGEAKRGVTGFQVVGDRALVSFGALNVVQVFDLSGGLAGPWRGFGWDVAYKQFEDQRPKLIRDIRLPSPGRLRKYGLDKVVTTSAADVVTIDLATYQVEPLIRGKLENPQGLGVDSEGNVYVGQGDPLHQVFGYTAEGKRFVTLGKPGRREVGPFDPDDLEEPFGVEVGPQGRVWVMEHTDWPKRVSTWDPKTGKCVNAVYGPTQYGGGGCLDPADPNRLFYKGLEMRRDAATGNISPVRLYYRPDSKRYARFPHQDFPEYAFRSEGKLWMTSFMWPHDHPMLVLWVYKQNHVMPAAAMGSVNALRVTFGLEPASKSDRKALEDTSFLKEFVPGYDEQQKIFTWTDLNADGFVQAAELKFGKLEHEGKPIARVSAGWNWRMNERFETAANAGYQRMVFFRPKDRSQHGYPIYDVPTRTHAGRGEALGCDGRGNAIVLGGPLSCIEPDGRVRWTYRNDWPGLHAGHRTTARGDEPGVLIAPTRIWGFADAGGALGEVVAINSNLGCTYLMTTDDGLFVDRVFRDQRIGLLWRTSSPQSPEVLSETSLYDEHFGGTFQRVRGADGKPRFYYVAGKNHCSVVELTGLQNIRRLGGGRLTIAPQQIAAAARTRQIAAAKKAEPKIYTVGKVAPGHVTVDGRDGEWPKQRIDGFALTYDDKHLYVLFQGNDHRATFQNQGANPLELFKTGDVIDVMLQTRAGLEPGRTEAGPGDVRLSFAMFEDKPVCVLYDFHVEANRKARVPFSSPWRTVWCDRVAILDDAQVAVERHGGNYTLEASLPLESIHLDPKSLRRTRGDVGRVLSDQTGSAVASRRYWANKHTAIMSDLPSEAALAPNLWGLFTFED